MKVGLFIVTMLHDITQAGYKVAFMDDFQGMMRIDFRKPSDVSFYEHEHCGCPGGTRNQLEKEVQGALLGFKTRHSLPSVTEHEEHEAADTGSES